MEGNFVLVDSADYSSLAEAIFIPQSELIYANYKE
jgi:hypothetical protein